MEIDNAIFQGLESFRKERLFNMAIKSIEFLFGEILKHPKMVQCSIVLNTYMLCLFILLFVIIK